LAAPRPGGVRRLVNAHQSRPGLGRPYQAIHRPARQYSRCFHLRPTHGGIHSRPACLPASACLPRAAHRLRKKCLRGRPAAQVRPRSGPPCLHLLGAGGRSQQHSHGGQRRQRAAAARASAAAHRCAPRETCPPTAARPAPLLGAARPKGPPAARACPLNPGLTRQYLAPAHNRGAPTLLARGWKIQAPAPAPTPPPLCRGYLGPSPTSHQPPLQCGGNLRCDGRPALDNCPASGAPPAAVTQPSTNRDGPPPTTKQALVPPRTLGTRQLLPLLRFPIHRRINQSSLRFIDGASTPPAALQPATARGASRDPQSATARGTSPQAPPESPPQSRRACCGAGVRRARGGQLRMHVCVSGRVINIAQLRLPI
jgi:hypothetical protein